MNVTLPIDCYPKVVLKLNNLLIYRADLLPYMFEVSVFLRWGKEVFGPKVFSPALIILYVLLVRRLYIAHSSVESLLIMRWQIVQ